MKSLILIVISFVCFVSLDPSAESNLIFIDLKSNGICKIVLKTLFSADFFTQVINTSKLFEAFVCPEAKELIPGLMILAEKANYAKQNKDLELMSEVISESVTKLEIFIQINDIIELKDDLETLLSKLKDLEKEFDQRNGSFETIQIFDLVVLELLAKFVETLSKNKEQ